jgi:hypothetical protein
MFWPECEGIAQSLAPHPHFLVCGVRLPLQAGSGGLGFPTVVCMQADQGQEKVVPGEEGAWAFLCPQCALLLAGWRLIGGGKDASGDAAKGIKAGVSTGVSCSVPPQTGGLELLLARGVWLSVPLGSEGLRDQGSCIGFSVPGAQREAQAPL